MKDFPTVNEHSTHTHTPKCISSISQTIWHTLLSWSNLVRMLNVLLTKCAPHYFHVTMLARGCRSQIHACLSSFLMFYNTTGLFSKIFIVLPFSHTRCGTKNEWSILETLICKTQEISKFIDEKLVSDASLLVWPIQLNTSMYVSFSTHEFILAWFFKSTRFFHYSEQNVGQATWIVPIKSYIETHHVLRTPVVSTSVKSTAICLLTFS